LDDVAKALVNIRLRRGHELEVGREWIERAKQAPDTDENDHEADRESYTRFCLGLDRLDAAALQLDDTLLALTDFR
jgi:DNA-directed RNA polymerase III subunit RPC3